MVVLSCPQADCEFTTGDVDVLSDAVAFLTNHLHVNHNVGVGTGHRIVRRRADGVYCEEDAERSRGDAGSMFTQRFTSMFGSCCRINRASSSSEEVMEAGMAVEDFIQTGRTGRRNAVANLQDARIGALSTAGMDFSFDKMSVTDSKTSLPEPSSKSPSNNNKATKSETSTSKS